MLVIGDKEVLSESVSVRKLGGEDLGVMRIGDFCDHLGHDIALFGRRSSSAESQ
jgi:threonyl-tRNA synthetase